MIETLKWFDLTPVVWKNIQNKRVWIRDKRDRRGRGPWLWVITDGKVTEAYSPNYDATVNGLYAPINPAGYANDDRWEVAWVD